MKRPHACDSGVQHLSISICAARSSSATPSSCSARHALLCIMIDAPDHRTRVTKVAVARVTAMQLQHRARRGLSGRLHACLPASLRCAAFSKTTAGIPTCSRQDNVNARQKISAHTLVKPVLSKQAAVKPVSFAAHPLQPQSSSQAAYATTDNNHRVLELCKNTVDC